MIVLLLHRNRVVELSTTLLYNFYIDMRIFPFMDNNIATCRSASNIDIMGKKATDRTTDLMLVLSEKFHS